MLLPPPPPPAALEEVEAKPGYFISDEVRLDTEKGSWGSRDEEVTDELDELCCTREFTEKSVVDEELVETAAADEAEKLLFVLSSSALETL